MDMSRGMIMGVGALSAMSMGESTYYRWPKETQRWDQIPSKTRGANPGGPPTYRPPDPWTARESKNSQSLWHNDCDQPTSLLDNNGAKCRVPSDYRD